MTEYLSHRVQSALIRERQRQPIERDGVTWYISSDAAQRTGCSVQMMRIWTRNIEGANVVLTADNGARFIRVPRCPGDLRPPIFWDVESLKRLTDEYNV